MEKSSGNVGKTCSARAFLCGYILVILDIFNENVHNEGTKSQLEICVIYLLREDDGNVFRGTSGA